MPSHKAVGERSTLLICTGCLACKKHIATGTNLDGALLPDLEQHPDELVRWGQGPAAGQVTQELMRARQEGGDRLWVSLKAHSLVKGLPDWPIS